MHTECRRNISRKYLHLRHVRYDTFCVWLENSAMRVNRLPLAVCRSKLNYERIEREFSCLNAPELKGMVRSAINSYLPWER